jgi:hypothetical protein
MYFPLLLSLLLTTVTVKFRVKCVEVLGVQVILHDAQGFAESLEMYDFTFTQELDRISYIGIVNETKDVVVSCSCFLLCCTFIKITFSKR